MWLIAVLVKPWLFWDSRKNYRVMKNKNSVGFDGNLPVYLRCWIQQDGHGKDQDNHEATFSDWELWIFCECSVETIINEQLWYLPENMHGVRCHYYTVHIAYTHTNDKHIWHVMNSKLHLFFEFWMKWFILKISYFISW